MHRDRCSGTGVDRARRAELGNGENGADFRSGLRSQPLPLLTEQQECVRRQVKGLYRDAPGKVVDADQHDVIRATPFGQRLRIFVMPDVLISIGDHGPPAIPALAPDDVHLLGQEGIRGAHDRTDIEVVVEILDSHVEGMTPRVKVGDDGLETPVAVLVHDIAAVTYGEKLRIKATVIGPRLRVRPDAMRCAVVIGAGVRLIHVPTIAW